ncbi:helix-turn-helix domain-containing protein, partial [Streptomyces sp. NPDC039028]|uniref:helix-turn-helix domain-containing protein n=1 Tax=Streptomyces sp. NPDC039028 TaxID=3155370 RepID=UPI0033DE1CC9
MEDTQDIDAIAMLQDPVRRRLYAYVVAQGREVGRNEAAEATGVARTLAAHHLDKLTGAGLLESGSRRLTGRLLRHRRRRLARRHRLQGGRRAERTRPPR